MNWYKLSQTDVAPVKCYGCSKIIMINSDEWIKKRSDPGNWRCSDCKKHRFSNANDDQLPRDRKVSYEYNRRAQERDHSNDI